MPDERRGFFAALFDLSFSSLITTTIIKVLYVLSLVLLTLGALGFVIGGFASGAGRGLLLLVIAVVGWLVYAIFIRVSLEVIIAIFRIMETNVEIRDGLRGSAPPPAPGTPPRPEAPGGS